MKTFLLSIIIPTRDDFNRLKLTLESLNHLQLPSSQVIIVNGGAPLPKYIYDLLNQLCFQLLQARDEGIYDAMNKGAAKASGHWLYFLNCGDIVAPSLSPHSLVDTLLNAKRELTAAIFFRYSLDSQPNTVYRSLPRLKQLLPYFSICHQSVIVDRLNFLRLDGYDHSYKYHADRLFFASLLYDTRKQNRTSPLHLVVWQCQGFCTSNQSDYDQELAKVINSTGIVQRLLSRFLLLIYQILLRLPLGRHTLNRLFYL